MALRIAEAVYALGTASFFMFWVLAVFPRFPVLPIGRTAGALLGATLMVLFQIESTHEAYASVDLPILGLLFGTMVVTIYLERAGLFNHLGDILSWGKPGAKSLMCRLSIMVAITSALFTNDSVCVAMTGFVLKLCREKGLAPEPFLMALATSANIGSAATPIGNPQNLIIAVQGKIAFANFLRNLLPPVVVAIFLNTCMLLLVYRNRLYLSTIPTNLETCKDSSIIQDIAKDTSVNTNNGKNSILLEDSNALDQIEEDNSQTNIQANNSQANKLGSCVVEMTTKAPPSSSTTLSSCNEINNIGLSKKGGQLKIVKERRVARFKKWCVLLVTMGMLVALLCGLDMSWSALTAAVVLMVLDFKDSGGSLDKVSYSLLVFFSGMFITVDGFNRTKIPGYLWSKFEPIARINRTSGIIVLTFVIIILSNVASNVPTVLMLGPQVAASAEALHGASPTKAWLILAWVSTLAGNLTLVGSAANLIVSEQAKRDDTSSTNLSCAKHLRFGPISTLIITFVGLPIIHLTMLHE